MCVLCKPTQVPCDVKRINLACTYCPHLPGKTCMTLAGRPSKSTRAPVCKHNLLESNRELPTGLYQAASQHCKTTCTHAKRFPCNSPAGSFGGSLPGCQARPSLVTVAHISSGWLAACRSTQSLSACRRSMPCRTSSVSNMCRNAARVAVRTSLMSACPPRATLVTLSKNVRDSIHVAILAMVCTTVSTRHSQRVNTHCPVHMLGFLQRL